MRLDQRERGYREDSRSYCKSMRCEQSCKVCRRSMPQNLWIVWWRSGYEWVFEYFFFGKDVNLTHPSLLSLLLNSHFSKIFSDFVLSLVELFKDIINTFYSIQIRYRQEYRLRYYVTEYHLLLQSGKSKVKSHCMIIYYLISVLEIGCWYCQDKHTGKIYTHGRLMYWKKETYLLEATFWEK